MTILRETQAPLSDDAYNELRSRFHDDEGNYQRLTGNVQGVRGRSSIWDTDQVLERYTQETDRMIGILDGSIDSRVIEDPDNPELSTQKPDSVIWLDKSARPVSWFTDALWEQFAKPGELPPENEFLNIDRVNWFVRQGHRTEEAERRLGPEDFDINAVSDEDIAGIRAYFSIGKLDQENWIEDVWKLPTRLDGKNVLIIDEVKNRGGTLSIATQLLKRAIPEMTVSGDYFWNPGRYAINPASSDPSNMQMESAPVWYDKDNTLGRGIGEISLRYWKRLYEQDPSDENLKHLLAGHVLSSPLHDPVTFEPVEDPLAMKLQQDIAYMTYGIADGRVRHIPGRGRDEEDVDAIMKRQKLDVRRSTQYSERRNKDIQRRLGR